MLDDDDLEFVRLVRFELAHNEDRQRAVEDIVWMTERTLLPDWIRHATTPLKAKRRLPTKPRANCALSLRFISKKNARYPTRYVRIWRQPCGLARVVNQLMAH